MGVLYRATRREIEADASWWPELMAKVGEEGSGALRGFAKERYWSAGELWRWLREDENRWGEYLDAKRFFSERLIGEVVGIADASEDAKLRVDTRFRVAEKWWPEVYGRREGVGVAVAVVDAGFVERMGELLGRVRERVIEPAE